MPKPRIDRGARLHAAQEERGGDEERERDRDLSDHEEIARRRATGPAGVGILVLDRLDDRGARRLQRGQESEHHTRQC